MQTAQSKTSKELFAKYLNNIFIETGTYHGDSVQTALDSGFKTICSIELGESLYRQCIKRFIKVNNVHLFNGDSSELLPIVIKDINEPVTFWLDSHYSGVDTVQGKTNTPLLQELEIIRGHYIKNHTIMIDDLRGWYKHTHGFDTLDLMKKIMEINSDYIFKLENGFIENDILVAYVNKVR